MVIHFCDSTEMYVVSVSVEENRLFIYTLPFEIHVSRFAIGITFVHFPTIYQFLHIYSIEEKLKKL
jgi:hypothetical protein